MQANTMRQRATIGRRRACALQLLAASWLVPLATAPAAAQSGSDQAEQASEARAREAYQAGVSAFQNGDYERARAQFEAADSAFPSPNAKLMLGQALLKLERAPEAYTAFSAVVSQARALAQPRYEAAAKAAAQALKTLEKSLALINVRVDDPTEQAVLRVAGREVARAHWDDPIAVEPGAIDVALRGPQGRADVKQLEMSAGTAATLAMAIEPQPVVTTQPRPRPQTRANATEPKPAPQAALTRGPTLRPLSYAAAGVGAAAIVAFGVLGAMSNAEHARLAEACPDPNVCDPSLRTHATRGATYQTLANVSLGVGVAALAAGVALWIVGLPAEQPSALAAAEGGTPSATFIGRF